LVLKTSEEYGIGRGMFGMAIRKGGEIRNWGGKKGR